jgi:hypothetical protein
MADGVIAQFATGNVFSCSPRVIAVQVGAFLVLVWAGLAFWSAQLSPGSQSDRGGLGDQRTASVFSASDLHRVQCVQRGWSGGALVLDERVVGMVLSGSDGLRPS